jgi:hypothetical protein
MHVAKLKDGPKRAMKLSQMILERDLEMVWRGRNGLPLKDFEVKRFFSSQNIDFPFLFTETLRAFSFSVLSLSLSLSFFNAPSFLGLGDLDDKRGKNSLQKFLFR